jgi:Uma2 family endonuclease
MVKLTYDDFVQFPDDGLRHELIDGKHYVTPSPATRHQRIVGRLFGELYGYLRSNGRGEAFVAPFDVVFSTHDVVEPDVLVILAGQEDILTPKNIQGAPAIVIEVLSPGTRRRDKTLKRQLYARAGVREYWMIDPDANVVTVGRFEDEGTETVVAEKGQRAELVSPLLPGWSIAVDELLA